ncbi:MAG: hypothetical protein GY953_25590, partial [bacterium]|nr:hypothetical protein [bacterium]
DLGARITDYVSRDLNNQPGMPRLMREMLDSGQLGVKTGKGFYDWSKRDAEGRLILADALTYAQRLGCTHLLDAATLTGAIVVALGHVYTGAFANDQDLADRVLAAAAASGEKTWQMPLDEEYRALLDSPFADLPNIGPRTGGAVTAAWFLKEFADPAPWVHLDIAGTAWLAESKPYLAKGPTGVGVRTMVRLATEWA